MDIVLTLPKKLYGRAREEAIRQLLGEITGHQFDSDSISVESTAGDDRSIAAEVIFSDAPSATDLRLISAVMLYWLVGMTRTSSPDPDKITVRVSHEQQLLVEADWPDRAVQLADPGEFGYTVMTLPELRMLTAGHYQDAVDALRLEASTELRDLQIAIAYCNSWARRLGARTGG